MAAALGLTPVPATQVVARDRHAEYLWACAAVGATVEQIGLELRHLQRTEVREVEEGFRAGQKGSSAMPHKRNPITAERLCGLARILRGNLQAGIEDVALWHERDISHSSVERVILPDSSLAGVLRAAHGRRRWCANLRVDADRMLANLWSSHGLVFSQPVLLALVAGGHGARRRLPHRAGAGPPGLGGRRVVPLAAGEGRAGAAHATSSSTRSSTSTRAVRNAGATFDALDAVEA